jgi:hypothetical protein
MRKDGGKHRHLRVCKLLRGPYSSGPKARRTAIFNSRYASYLNHLSPLDFNIPARADRYNGEAPYIAKPIVTGRIHYKCLAQPLVSTSAPMGMPAYHNPHTLVSADKLPQGARPN